VQEWADLERLVARRLTPEYGSLFSLFCVFCKPVLLWRTGEYHPKISQKLFNYLKPFMCCNLEDGNGGQVFSISCKQMYCNKELFNWKLILCWYLFVWEIYITYRFFAQRSCVQRQVGWSFEQPGLVEGVPVHGRGGGIRWSVRSLPTQTILWFYVLGNCRRLQKIQSFSLHIVIAETVTISQNWRNTGGKL